MLHQIGVFRDNQVVMTRVMDSNDLRARDGAASPSGEKHGALLSRYENQHRGYTRHSDFGGEVDAP